MKSSNRISEFINSICKLNIMIEQEKSIDNKTFEEFVDSFPRYNKIQCSEDVYRIYTYLTENKFFDSYLVIHFDERVIHADMFSAYFIQAFLPMIVKLESNERRLANIFVMEERISRVELLRNIVLSRYPDSKDRYIDFERVINVMRISIKDLAREYTDKN